MYKVTKYYKDDITIQMQCVQKCMCQMQKL